MSWRQDWWFRWMLGRHELLDLMALFRDHCLFPSFFWFQGQTNQYRGFIDCAQTIMREEGAGAFLKVKLLHRNRRSNKNLHIDDQKQQAFTSRHISNSVWYTFEASLHVYVFCCYLSGCRVSSQGYYGLALAGRSSLLFWRKQNRF